MPPGIVQAPMHKSLREGPNLFGYPQAPNKMCNGGKFPLPYRQYLPDIDIFGEGFINVIYGLYVCMSLAFVQPLIFQEGIISDNYGILYWFLLDCIQASQTVLPFVLINLGLIIVP